jgi:hypothetical protein
MKKNNNILSVPAKGLMLGALLWMLIVLLASCKGCGKPEPVVLLPETQDEVLKNENIALKHDYDSVMQVYHKIAGDYREIQKKISALEKDRIRITGRIEAAKKRSDIVKDSSTQQQLSACNEQVNEYEAYIGTINLELEERDLLAVKKDSAISNLLAAINNQAIRLMNDSTRISLLSADNKKMADESLAMSKENKKLKRKNKNARVLNKILVPVVVAGGVIISILSN